MGRSRANPSVIIPLSKHLSNDELDELMQATLEKQGVPKEQWQAVMERAENDSALRVKVEEARKELHMRVREQYLYPRLRWGGLKPVRKRSQH